MSMSFLYLWVVDVLCSHSSNTCTLVILLQGWSFLTTSSRFHALSLVLCFRIEIQKCKDAFVWWLQLNQLFQQFQKYLRFRHIFNGLFNWKGFGQAQQREYLAVECRYEHKEQMRLQFTCCALTVAGKCTSNFLCRALASTLCVLGLGSWQCIALVEDIRGKCWSWRN